MPDTMPDTTAPLAAELAVAAAAVRAAAAVCQKVQADLVTAATLEKKDKSPVTVADFASQAIVCKMLADAFPDDPVVGEEGSADLREGSEAANFEHTRDKVVAQVRSTIPDATESQVLDWIDRGAFDPAAAAASARAGAGAGAGAGVRRYWTLDPIDGTKGFLRGEQYAVALALIVDGRVVLGALGCPNLPHAGADATGQGQNPTGTLMLAVKGHGAVQTAICPSAGDSTQGEPIAVSDIADVTQAPLCESVESGHTDQGASGQIKQALGIVAEPVRIDSQAKYATVARGDASIYLRLPTRPGYEEKIWDHAAGYAVVTEAGGTVTDVTGKPLDFALGRTLRANKGVICTNGHVHDAVLTAVKNALGA